MDWLTLYRVMAVSVIAIGVGAGLILFGYWLGRKTVTQEPMVVMRRTFDPGPTDPAEMSELDDAFATEDDYEADLS